MSDAGFSRREFLSRSGRIGLAGIIAGALPAPGWVLRPRQALASSFTLTTPERATIGAALRRMIPADGEGDWDAVDAGALDYIETLLATDLETGSVGIYAGGPYRVDFASFQNLSPVKRKGWKCEIDRLRQLYRDGAAELDRRAGGNFAALPEEIRAELQDAILTTLDLENSDFFRALYHHTMEGVYGHPAYGGNTDFIAWSDLCYQGDVHGVRYPDGQGATTDAWNVFGGYAPDEMDKPGGC